MSNPKKNIENIRIDYDKSKIDFNSINTSPFTLFNSWMTQAFQADKENANAFVLSTISNKMAPSSRVVLMRGFSEKGLVFYTNYNSQKATEIMSNKNVSANFFWPQLEKQIRIIGNAEKISKEESDKYFNSRPLESKIGAIISNQSSTISLDHNFEKEKEKLQSQSNSNSPKRPENWGGYIIKIYHFEFWQGRPSRLHDRLCYTLENNKWVISRKSP